jgi:hypothetical protein
MKESPMVSILFLPAARSAAMGAMTRGRQGRNQKLLSLIGNIIGRTR